MVRISAMQHQNDIHIVHANRDDSDQAVPTNVHRINM